jgi:hypothetical protein
MQVHIAARPGIFSDAAGDSEHGIAGIEKRPLDRDLAVGKRKRPEAFPCLARDPADAPAIVGADLVGVGRVIDVVGEE